MTTRNDRFWAKVLFREYIKHFRKLSDEEIVRDVRQSMDDLEELVDDTDTFGAKMVRWSFGRADQYPMARENGKKGGRPRKNPEENLADADIREDSENLHRGSNAVTLESPTSAATTTTPLPPEGTDDQKKAESRKGRTRSSNYSLSESVVDTDERVQSCEVLNLAYSGRNGLVVLSQEEYNRLLQETGNKKKADRLVDSLDYALAEGKEFNQKHINVLLHWKDYRDEKLIAAKYGKNFADRQDQMVRDNMQLADDIRNGRIAL